MYACPVDRLAPGAVLAQSLFGDHGDILLTEGTALSEGYIERLRRRGVAAVMLCDGLADDVCPHPLVSEPLRTAVVCNVRRLFDGVESLAANTSQGGQDRPGTVEEAADRLGNRQLAGEGADPVEALYADIERLMAEILEQESVTSLESLKSHNAYTFEHSVDVAVVGILLGRQAGLTRIQLRELALGALLHDVGKVYIDAAILDKPGPLTEAEMAEVRKHPLMGYELARRMPVSSIVPAHVAYQHHERQDGDGYPRGLIGNNRLQRTIDDRIDARRMLLIAEIAAVADVYSAVSSHRPYRPAMLPDRIAVLLAKLAGGHLNRDVVSLLLRTMPPYPVGHWITVTSGAYPGWRGVVTSLDYGTLERPRVRLLIDDNDEAVADPVELDLAGLPEVSLACVAEDSIPPSSAQDRRVSTGS